MLSGYFGQNLLKGIYVLLSGGPAGDKAADFVAGIVGAPFLKYHLLAQAVHDIVAEYDELLVGRRFYKDLSDTLFYKQIGQLKCEIVRLASYVFIQAVGEKGVELQPREAAFRI